MHKLIENSLDSKINTMGNILSIAYSVCASKEDNITREFIKALKIGENNKK